MNLKFFLKPNLVKIVVAIIISLIIGYFLTGGVTCPELAGYDCSQEINQAKQNFLVISLFLIPVWYLLLCIFFAFFEKFKNKITKRKIFYSIAILIIFVLILFIKYIFLHPYRF